MHNKSMMKREPSSDNESAETTERETITINSGRTLNRDCILVQESVIVMEEEEEEDLKPFAYVSLREEEEGISVEEMNVTDPLAVKKESFTEDFVGYKAENEVMKTPASSEDELVEATAQETMKKELRRNPYRPKKRHQRLYSRNSEVESESCEDIGIPLKQCSKRDRIRTGEGTCTCEICQKEFARHYSLTLHMRRHTGEKPYKCQVCKEAFSRSYSLTLHMRKHTGEKPYKCDVCYKVFAVSCSLKAHTRTHTGEKPFNCDYCKKLYSDYANLTVHMRKHTGEKPYKCKVCKEAFSRSYSLTVHMRKHTGEKPYKCDICKKSYSVSSVLTRHMRKHTAKKT